LTGNFVRKISNTDRLLNKGRKFGWLSKTLYFKILAHSLLIKKY